MAKKDLRIVSLLPSTTEIVAALGFEDQLVGRSHECDFPSSVGDLPICTEPKFNPEGQSYQIDQRVKSLLQEGLSVYRVDAEALAKLRPDLIITQDHCEVCAVSVDAVKEATREILGNPIEIISVSPTNLEEVYDSVSTIAKALGAGNAGRQLIYQIKEEFAALSERCCTFKPKKMVCIEWLDPLMTAGNWVPELAEIAGLGVKGSEAGTHSPWVEWADIREAEADVICIMPCGYSIGQTLEEMSALTNQPGWDDLAAAKNKQVYIADGHHYFNRPGPRLVDSARILAEIAHHDLKPAHNGKGWINYSK